MHDIRAIRDNPEAFVAGWSSRGVDDAADVVARILALDVDLRAAQTRGQDALAKRNAASKAIGAAMGKKDMAEADRLKAEVEALKSEINQAGLYEAVASDQLRDLLAGLKNIAAIDVPDGQDETDNVEVLKWGEPRTTGAAKDHADLGEALGLLDFEAAAKMSGSRFAVLKGQLARLERAIGQFMLDLQTDRNGYLEVNPPYLVKGDAMFGTGQLPKFKEDLFASPVIDFETTKPFTWDNTQHPAVRFEDDETQQRLNEAVELGGTWTAGGTRQSNVLEHRVKVQRDFYLIPTAEVSLTNLVREQILSEDEVAQPLRDRPDALLPRRSGVGGTRYARPDPPAPVLQGRDGLHLPSRGFRGRA